MNNDTKLAAMPSEIDIANSTEDAPCYLSSSMPVLRQYLTIEEEREIIQQFRRSWRPNAQVLWNGIPREEAQKWADEHRMQTLTTVMGFLMNKKDPLCPNHDKSKSSWTKYIKGASAVFAWSVSREKTVVVLSPPPPQRFNPVGFTNFQMIEAPILQWAASLTHTRLQIYSVHPMVKGAEDFRYEIWPADETRNWDARFKTVRFQRRKWRVPSWDSWKVLIRSTLDSMVGSGFWIGSELFGLSKWKQDSARIRGEKEQKERERKMRKEAKKAEEGKKLGQEEKKRKNLITAKTTENTTENQKPGQELKKPTKKKKKKKKKKRKEKRKAGGNGETETKKAKNKKET